MPANIVLWIGLGLFSGAFILTFLWEKGWLNKPKDYVGGWGYPITYGCLAFGIGVGQIPTNPTAGVGLVVILLAFGISMLMSRDRTSKFYWFHLIVGPLICLLGLIALVWLVYGYFVYGVPVLVLGAVCGTGVFLKRRADQRSRQERGSRAT